MSRVRLSMAFLCSLALVLLANGNPSGQAPRSPQFVPGEVLLKFTPNARALDRANARAQLEASTIRTFRNGAEHWKLKPGMTVDDAIERLRRHPHIEYAEPNYLLSTQIVPNDPRLPELYGMINTGQTGGTANADIDADMAWNVSRGSRNVVVAVIDTGVDYNHPDLAANMWRNPDEIAGNGIDDDGNGYIDDVHGYDWVNSDGDPFDDNGHGTHCAGTIGAVGNNGIGVVGVNWEVSIMALKFLSGAGSGSTANAVLAVDYATANGAHIMSNSWGGGGFSQTLLDAIVRANNADIPFIAAAGNNGTNNDTSPHYPSNYDVANVISVAATDHNDARASFSNYGRVTVDIGAPGVNILSTQPGGLYRQLSGTSMATPHVAGAAALVKSVFPAIPAPQLKLALMTSATPVAALRVDGPTPVASGGRLNAFFAIAAPDDVPPGTIIDFATQDPGSNHMGLRWTATGDDGQIGTASFYQVRYSTSPIDEGNFGAAQRAGGEPNPRPVDSAQVMEVRGLQANTTYYFAIKAFDEFGNPGPVSNLALGTTLPPPTAAVSPASINQHLFTGQTAQHLVNVRNDGVGTLDFTIAQPALGEPVIAQEPLVLEKDETDPRPGVLGAGGPDAFGYRWLDSHQPGGPVFSWTDISTTGTLVADVTTDDDISAAIPLGFDFPFYGGTFKTVRISSNGFLSFTSSTTAPTNQPLPNTGAPQNLIAPFWDDLHPGGVARIYMQTTATRAIIQWHQIPRFLSGAPGNQEPGSSVTFQAILDASGAITFQYLNMVGTLNSATIGIQNEPRTIGLMTAFNDAYVQDNLAVRITQLPQWLTVSPTAGRVAAGGTFPLNVNVDAARLEGGTYPGTIEIRTNDPNRPSIPVHVTLVVTGAPDATAQPAALAFGDRFVDFSHTLTLAVSNIGTAPLIVSNITADSAAIAVTPSSFTVPAHATQNVLVRWTPAGLGAFSATLTIHSDDAGEPALNVPITGTAIPSPIVVVDPQSIAATLSSGNTATQALRVTNAGGSNLIVTAAADQGNGGNGLVIADETGLGSGGPDGFGYRWRDSDASGGPPFTFVDISTSGTPIVFSSPDTAMSAAIDMGMTFPFYGENFTGLKVSTNGWLTFTTSYTGSALTTNANLPSTTLPGNSIAMFWDDLHLRGGSVSYQNDGSRFIVQFTNVGRFSPSTGQSYTFQVQLYPDGRILMLYGNMTGTLNSATIGIQNGTRTIALPVAFNTTYLHNDLALQISRVPNWLTVTPSGATIAPGATHEFSVTLDATGRPAGVLNGNIVLTTNIPGQETVLIPSALTVLGAPKIELTPDAINYGTVFLGFPQLTSFIVINNGTETLNVTDITSTDPSVTIEDAPGPTAAFELQPGAARLLTVRWNPVAAGPLSARIDVLSDDPAARTASIAVTGIADAAPSAVHSPAAFDEAVSAGEVRTRTLRLENPGGSNLSFAAVVQKPATTAVADDDREALGGGGPDKFGYRWTDSNAPGGPAFSFVDISAIGTPIAALTTDNQDAGPIPIGFDFPFYGTTFNTVRVKTNGFLSFSSTLTDSANDPLPGTAAPPNLIAVFWDDLHFRNAVRARYYNDGTRFIVQWTDVDRASTSEQPSPASLTFQAILYPNGRIVMQYATMTGFLTGATIGMQNAARDDGLQVAFNTAYMQNNLAIEIRPPDDFVTVSPAQGIVPPGGAIELDVRMDASNLIGGDYGAVIDLRTNDPLRPAINVPVSLHVTGIPDIAIDPPSVEFPSTFIGFSSTRPLTIRNTGTDVLTLTAASLSGDFTQTGVAPPISLAVGESLPVSLVFTPTAAGNRTGALVLTSNDPDEGTITVPLSGPALVPPVVGATPAAIATALAPGGTRTKTLTIANTGGSDLHWTIGTNIASAVPPGTYVELDKDEPDTRPGILGSGGPDLFGYRWRDSDAPSGPSFAWFDIREIGTEIANLDGDDENSGPIPIGFPFSFYGNTFNDVRVTTNGWISFTSTRTTFTNQALPNAGTTVPENVIAAFWDDLHFRGARKARYYNDGTRFIVQWTEVDRRATAVGGSPLTFQIQLYPNGRILMLYHTMNTPALDSATIGIQNATKDDGLTMVFNALYVHDGMAIEITRIPQWITASPSGGTVPAGGTQQVTLLLNAAGLEDGMHEAFVDVSSNDPHTPRLSVPVRLNTGFVSPTLIDFDPDAFNAVSRGRCVKVIVELPAGLDPRAVNLSSLTINDTVRYPTAPCGAPEFTDVDADGVQEISLKFIRADVAAVLGEGELVPLTIQGEVADVQWFRGTGVVRTIRRR